MKQLVWMFAFAWLLQPAGAMERGTTEQGRPFVSGGVGAEEMAALNNERSQYSLAILAAAKGSGAFLGDVHIRITDGQSNRVLDTVMDGPWLFVDVPAGRYQVEADLDARLQKSVVTIRSGDHRQTIFYFDTHDKVEASPP